MFGMGEATYFKFGVQIGHNEYYHMHDRLPRGTGMSCPEFLEVRQSCRNCRVYFAVL